jgi:hypothetical protein
VQKNKRKIERKKRKESGGGRRRKKERMREWSEMGEGIGVDCDGL